MTPDDRKYTPSHEWIRLEGDLAVVGITDFAQEAMGDVTFVELPETGRAVARGDACGVIESVKAASDIYAPVDGEIVETNKALDGAPERINESPYEDGWLFKLRNANGAQLAELLDAGAYDAHAASDA